MNKQVAVWLLLLAAGLSLGFVSPGVLAQAQHAEFVATFEEVVNQPAAVEWHGSNLFIVDAWTVIEFTGDWNGTSQGICNGVFHYVGDVPMTGNLHCSLAFTGTVLGREGTVMQNVNGTFQAGGVPEWTGHASLSKGTGELALIASNNIVYEQTGISGTLQGAVVFPQG